MVKGSKQRALQYLAHKIWLKRIKRNDPNANNEKENWERAKILLDKLKKRYLKT